MIQVKSLSEGKVGTAEVDEKAFGERLHPVVLKEAVLMYEANRRVGTASTKTRAEVRGSGRKIYRQKHTGRARHGDRRANIFRGGGVAHGPRPRDHRYSLPKKALRRALQVALAGKLGDGEVLRWQGRPLSTTSPSTKAAREALDRLGALDGALIVAPGPVDRALLLSVRNLPRVRVAPAAEVTAEDVVRHRWLVLLDDAFEALRQRVFGTPEESEEESAS